jgi:hypothetical protein
MGYVEHNINPKHKKTSDCAVRAVAVATDLSWDKAFEGLTTHAFMLKTVLNDPEAVESFLISIGFKIGHIKVAKGTHRPTVKSFAENNPNVYAVLRVAGHFTCSGRGNYVDTWDCGDYSVYKYWYKEIN